VKPKRVLETTGLSRAYLHDLVEHGDMALAPVKALLAAMQQESRVVQPAALGVLGEPHVRRHLMTHGHVEPDSLTYRKCAEVADGLPFVLEVACGWYTQEFQGCGQRSILGVNWSPAFKPPFPALPSLLGEARVDRWDPVVVLVHLAMPRIEFTDRGKGTTALPEAVCECLATAMAAVTKHWKSLKRQADRADRVRERELTHWLNAQHRPAVRRGCSPGHARNRWRILAPCSPTCSGCGEEPP
jgi:DNA topoisomerase VI subunit B